MNHRTVIISGKRIPPGRAIDLDIPVSGTAVGHAVTIPVRVVRGPEPGPIVAVTAAVHGDEITGMAIVRALVGDEHLKIERGTLILAPVVNVLGFERSSRYMPDRRDLNRSFPGSASGSLTARFARAVFEELIGPADALIDLHTAAAKRTNFPNVRVDLDHPPSAELARHFGAELTVHGKGPEGSLRRAAVEAGKAAIILEAGEVWKFDPAMTEIGLRGVRNALMGLGMMPGEPEPPLFRAESRKTEWARSTHGGILRFHVSPGDWVEDAQPLATVTTLLGRDLATIESPRAGVVLGMTTMPAVVPGDPVCHIATLDRGRAKLREAHEDESGDSLHHRVLDAFTANTHIEQPREDSSEPFDPDSEDAVL
ncbi:MAG: succinylglutamate desuccinylase/aspartoacylase family protein [Phycisphaerales bacterium JB037]